MDFLKQNVLPLAIIAYGTIAGLTGLFPFNHVPSDVQNAGIQVEQSGLFGATTARTTVTNPWTFTQGLTLTGTATTTFGAQSDPVYYTRGGIDYADVQVPLTASSSVVFAIPNPFGTATSSVLRGMVQVTNNGIGVTQTLDVSTSSTAVASSSPAFVKKFSTGAGQFLLPWNPSVASTTQGGLLGYDSFSNSGASPYVLAPNEFLTGRIATGTPGTFGSYWTGTASFTFMKP